MFGLRWLVSTVLILGLIWALMPESVRGQPQVVPVSEILAGKHTNQTVTVQGRTGYIVREESTATTTVYTLRDDYGDEIRIRSSQLQNLHMGITYRVKGTVVREGRKFYLIELERKPLGGIALTTPTAPIKEEKTWWQEKWLPLAIGGGLIVLAAFLFTISAVRQRKVVQAELEAQRQREEELRRQLAQLQIQQQSQPAREQPVSPPPTPFTEKPTEWVSPEVFAPPKKVTEEMWGTLEIISGPDQGKRFPLGGRKIVLGRTEGDIRFPNDSTVSSSHAEIILTADGRILFVDHSRNGSKVNDQIVHYSQVELKSGDVIDIGLTVLRFTGRAPAPTPAAPQPQAPVEVPLSQKPTELAVSPIQDIAHAPTGQFLGAELEVIRGPDKGKRFPLVKTMTTIGRMEDRDIQLTDITVSRRHCILEFRGGRFFIRNESTQGTKVNGELIQQERELNDGDEIEMGGTVIKFLSVKSLG